MGPIGTIPVPYLPLIYILNFYSSLSICFSNFTPNCPVIKTLQVCFGVSTQKTCKVVLRYSIKLSFRKRACVSHNTVRIGRSQVYVHPSVVFVPSFIAVLHLLFRSPVARCSSVVMRMRPAAFTSEQIYVFSIHLSHLGRHY